MNFFRKYKALLMPIGVVLFAGLLFVPTILMGSSVKKQIDKESIRPARRIKSMLSDVPSARQHEVERRYQSQHKKDADSIEQMVRQGSQRQVLSFELLPAPKEASKLIFIEFGDAYRSAIEELVKNMDALDVPSEIEIQKAGRTGKQSSRGSGRMTGRVGRSRLDPVRDAVCKQRAESIQVYANPNLFKWYNFWEDYEWVGVDDAVEDCWYSHVGYWIYEDVVQTIIAANKNSENVYTSGVKRLLGVNFTKPVGYGSTRGSTRGRSRAESDIPEYVLDSDVQIFGVQPWTGRVGNNDIDVVYFTFAVIIDSRTVMSFMKELCSQKEHLHNEGYQSSGQEKRYKHNQITILKSEVVSVDRQSSFHEDYRYGDGSVMRLDLVCEYIFNRSSYDSIKPESIKQLLGQSETSGQESDY